MIIIYNRGFILEKLKSTLSKNRYTHTIGVEKTAIKLADIYGIDKEKARYAALLHDCAKDYSVSELQKISLKYGIDFSSFKEYLLVLHSFVGAKVAQMEYCIDDKEVLNAIMFHATGRANMSTLEKIIFIADYIEPNRKEFEGLKIVRELVFHDLDQAVLKAINNTILYLKDMKQNVHPLTYEARDYYTQTIELRRFKHD